MKLLTLSGRQFERGNILAITMVFGAVVLVVLGSYLQLVQNRSLNRARALAWNAAIPVLEAGIEEALTHLHDDSTVLTSNKWTAGTNNGRLVYLRSRTNTDNSYWSVTISNVNSLPITSPVIYSQGFVPVPLRTGFISRKVQVNVTNPVVFTKGIAAKGLVTLSSGMTVDSFNSSNTNYSTDGQYDPAKREGNGGIVTDSQANPAIIVGNAHVYGMLDTGPNGTVSINNSGSVGDLSWSTNNTGIEAGYTNNDMNVTYPDQVPPTTTILNLPPLPGLYFYQGTNYTYQLGNVLSKVTGDFNLNSGQSMVVSGDAILYVTGNVTVNGNAFIYLAPNSSLQLYVGGANTVLAGGGIVNGSGPASKFAYYGLPGNTNVSYSGNSAFIGTINAPEAAVSLSGQNSFSGAVIANTFKATSSGAAFHYDEGLAALGILKLLSYREL